MLTLTSMLDRAGRLYGANPAIRDPEGVLSWSELLDRIGRTAGVLAALGVRPGDRFGVLSRNTVRHAEILYAGYWLGAIPVPINFRLAPPEIRFILDDADCRLLVVETPFADMVRSDDAFAPWRERALLLGREPDGGPWPHSETELAGATPADPRDAAEQDDAILLYTGGTTGRSKGVRLSHRNVVSNGIQVALAMQATAEDCYLHVAPMFHSADLLGTGFTLQGGSHAYLPQFGADALLEAIQDNQVTVTMLAPAMIVAALKEADIARYDLSRFRRIFYGSSPMAVEWIRRTMEGFPGVEIQQGYGLTETSPILTTLDVAEHEHAMASGAHDILRSAGRPVVGIDMRIVDHDGKALPAGEAGEVRVRGPNVTCGYLNRPEDNAAAFRDGWFHTGDVGMMDAAGYLYLLDRAKDMIITGGENVYSAEVEAALYAHEDVHEAAVIGVPDEKYGEALFAVIVPRPGATLDAETLIAHCRGRIGGYKIPRQYAFVDALPRSAMGKILKTELRKSYG